MGRVWYSVCFAIGGRGILKFVRPESPCLSSGSWQTNLKNAGFEKITTLTDREDDGDGIHTVFIGKKPEINPVSTQHRPFSIAAV